MTKDKAKTVMMDTFKAAWCADCHVSGELTYHNCNKYCGAYEQFKEAVETLEGENHDER